VRKKEQAPDKKWYKVPYRVTYEGTCDVEAASPEEACAIVESGDFEDHPGDGRCDWGATGPAREI
jgi:hypothetical protein